MKIGTSNQKPKRINVLLLLAIFSGSRPEPQYVCFLKHKDSDVCLLQSCCCY